MAKKLIDKSIDSPASPEHMDWSVHFPAFVDPDTTKTTITGARKLVKDVEVVDIGCGYGGLLVALAPLMPDTLMIGTIYVSLAKLGLRLTEALKSGMEIRQQVLEYVQMRVAALRHQQQRARGIVPTTPSQQASSPESQDLPPDAPSIPPSSSASVQGDVQLVEGGYNNISALRANTMKFLPNFFRRGQLSKIFICFPDPHFKARKHKARIVSNSLNAEYAYVLRPGGLFYLITDVEDYYLWALRHFGVRLSDRERQQQQQQQQKQGEGDDGQDDEEVGQHAGSGVARIGELFERLSDEELEADPCVRIMREETEEGKKVSRNNGPKYVAVFRRREDPEWD